MGGAIHGKQLNKYVSTSHQTVDHTLPQCSTFTAILNIPCSSSHTKIGTGWVVKAHYPKLNYP